MISEITEQHLNSLQSLTHLSSVLHTGNEPQVEPLPFMIPYTKETSGEINKQINRELFAHYTYLSMVSNVILFLPPVYSDTNSMRD